MQGLTYPAFSIFRTYKKCSIFFLISLWSQFSPKYSLKTPYNSSLIRARYGVSFVGSASDWYSASLLATMCPIPCFIGPRYNCTELYCGNSRVGFADPGHDWFRYGLAPVQHQTITWTNPELLLIGPFKWLFNDHLQNGCHLSKPRDFEISEGRRRTMLFWHAINSSIILCITWREKCPKFVPNLNSLSNH